MEFLLCIFFTVCYERIGKKSMCVDAKGWLKGRAAKLLLLLINEFIFNGIRELTSFGYGLAFPFFYVFMQ